ncbi:MAG TPA: TRAP transporter TatT component family protein [bacterium]|nr:TRAP transporter TatT component family protein [bacterium]
MAAMLLLALFWPAPSRAGDEEVARAVQLLDQGEKSLDIASLNAALAIFLKECQGPVRNSLCEYYIARVYLAQSSYYSRVKDDSSAANQALAQAEASGKEAILRRPNDPAVHVLMGKVLQVKLMRFPISSITVAMISTSPVITEYQRALELDPNNGPAELGLGIYYQFIPRLIGGDGHRARGHFRRAAELMPADPEPLVWTAISCRQEGRLGEAREALDRALALDPDDKFARAEDLRLRAAEKAQGGR